MKKYLLHSVILLFPIISAAQQVDLSTGVHVYDGGLKNAAILIGERSKMVSGIGAKQLVGNCGLYANFFSSKKMYGSDSINIYHPTFWNSNDSLVYDKQLIPYGFTIGASYTFPFRLSVFGGVGLSIFRKEHFVASYKRYPTATGFYSPYETLYTQQISETARKISFELLADYDFLKSNKWSIGPRLGFNTQNKCIAQLFFGYNFRKD